VADDRKDRVAGGAIIALTFISVLVLIAGVMLAFFGHDIPGVAAIVTGAVGGIVAIVLRDTEKRL
jgi:hypothetical protein